MTPYERTFESKGGSTMKCWKWSRNFRKILNEVGPATCTITVEGKKIGVSTEVYEAYSRMERRERYLYEREEGLLLSLEQLAEENVPLHSLMDKHMLSAEDGALRQMDYEQLRAALGSLAPESQKIIKALFFDGFTERQYATKIGVSQPTINHRKVRALAQLKKLLAA